MSPANNGYKLGMTLFVHAMLATTPPAMALLSKPSFERRIALDGSTAPAGGSTAFHSHPKPAYLNLSTLCRNKFYNS